MEDKRNVIDKYKGWAIDDIVADLDTNGSKLEIAIENTERDFNMGTIVRSANAFGVRHIHVIGRKQWNKRGAMMTDKYLHVHYYAELSEFLGEMKRRDRVIYAIDNITGAKPLGKAKFSENAVLVFGQEGPGISASLTDSANEVIEIEQYGSTRSINVGVAAGIAMYAWAQQWRNLA